MTPRFCRNPRCADWVPPGRWVCGSCRLAGRCGAALAFVVVFLWHAVPWLAWFKAIAGSVFH